MHEHTSAQLASVTPIAHVQNKGRATHHGPEPASPSHQSSVLVFSYLCLVVSHLGVFVNELTQIETLSSSPSPLLYLPSNPQIHLISIHFLVL